MSIGEMRPHGLQSKATVGTGPGELPDELAGRIERQIERRASGRIRNLRVACAGGLVVLQGWCRTYHAKQLAQEAALDLAARSGRLINQIVVC